MKKIKIIFPFLFLLVFTLILTINSGNNNVAEKNINNINNDLYNEKLISDTMDRYMHGDKNLKIIKNKDGNDKILVNDRITITNLGRINYNDSNINHLKYELKSKNIAYDGEIIKPANTLSSGLFSPKDSFASSTFTIKEISSYEIQGNFGVNFELFKSQLGSLIKKENTNRKKITYTVSKNKMGRVYGIKLYDKYIYNGWIRKGNILSLSSLNLFLVER